MFGREQDIRISWVHVYFVHTGIFSAGQDQFPVFTAINRLEQTAVAATGPQRTLRCHEDNIRITRVHRDHADVLGIFEPHVFPGSAAIQAFIHAVAITDVTPANVFAGANPDRVVIVRIYRDGAYGIGSLALKNRGQCGASVVCFPDSAAAHANVPGAAISRIDRDMCDTAGHQCRAYTAPLEAAEGSLIEAGRRCFVFLGNSRFSEDEQAGCRQQGSCELSHDGLRWSLFPAPFTGRETGVKYPER